MHRAKMDCLRKKVMFHTLDGQRVCFTGERNMIPSCMISALTANRLLRKGCEAFLAYAISSESNGLNLADIPMVYRFPDVFPKELPRLPPAEKWNSALIWFQTPDLYLGHPIGWLQ